MNPVILQLKGALAEKKQRRMDLTVRIDANVAAIKSLLATSSITPMADVDLRAVKLNADEAYQLQEDLKACLNDIENLQKELGDG